MGHLSSITINNDKPISGQIWFEGMEKLPVPNNLAKFYCTTEAVPFLVSGVICNAHLLQQLELGEIDGTLAALSLNHLRFLSVSCTKAYSLQALKSFLERNGTVTNLVINDWSYTTAKYFLTNSHLLFTHIRALTLPGVHTEEHTKLLCEYTLLPNKHLRSLRLKAVGNSEFNDAALDLILETIMRSEFLSNINSLVTLRVPATYIAGHAPRPFDPYLLKAIDDAMAIKEQQLTVPLTSLPGGHVATNTGNFPAASSIPNPSTPVTTSTTNKPTTTSTTNKPTTTSTTNKPTTTSTTNKPITTSTTTTSTTTTTTASTTSTTNKPTTTPTTSGHPPTDTAPIGIPLWKTFEASEIIFDDEVVEIGSGAFATVFPATLHGLPVAVKQFKRTSQSKAALENFNKELEVLSKTTTHPHLIRIFGVMITQNTFSIIMELMKTDLFNYLHPREGKRLLTNSAKFEIARGITLGMASLHRQRIIHRDLKSQNILLDSHCQVKIADFGISKYCPATLQTKTNTIGTVYYAAPELLSNDDYKSSVDVYSFGVIFWEICTQKAPYESEGLAPFQLMMRICNGLRPSLENLPETFQKFISDCWAEDNTCRPTFDQILDRILVLEKEIAEVWKFTDELKNFPWITTSAYHDVLVVKDETKVHYPILFTQVINLLEANSDISEFSIEKIELVHNSMLMENFNGAIVAVRHLTL